MNRRYELVTCWHKVNSKDQAAHLPLTIINVKSRNVNLGTEREALSFV